MSRVLSIRTTGLLVAIALGARVAAADPTPSRVLTAPTAWLPPENALLGTATMDHRFDGSVVVGYGLGGLAAVELGTDTDVRGCKACLGDKTPVYLGRAAFRIGARQDAWFPGMPAVLAGVRTTFASSGSFGRARVTEAYLVMSRELGPLRLHVGGSVIDASLRDDELGPTLQPIAGLEWTPSQYPKTTLMGDFAYVPLLEDEATADVTLEWVAGWGVRYQAFPWGAIELAVRHREDEGLGDSTVMVRVNGVWDPTVKPKIARSPR